MCRIESRELGMRNCEDRSGLGGGGGEGVEDA
jgi:hypothetical protein